MADIQLTLCGTPALSIDGVPVSGVAVPPKSLALLAVLAVEPGPHRRNDLATILWGESPEEKANTSLRQALSQLHRLLGDDLQISRSTVELRTTVRSDVAAFLAAAERDVVTAAEIDIPRFLAGVSPRNCPGFEQWSDGVRVDLLARFVGVLAECARRASARRDWQWGARLGETWLRADTSSDEAAFLLIESLYLAGNPAGALAKHAELVKRRKLGGEAAPGSSVCELVRRIEDGRRAGQAESGNDRWHESAANFEAALIGREREWEMLVSSWNEILDGRGRAVVIEGEVGAGKTRLADDFSRWVQARGGSVLRVRALDGGQAASFTGILDLLRAGLELPGASGTDAGSLGVLSRMVPEIRRRFPAIVARESEPVSPVLDEAVADLLLALADDHPLAIVIDDFQWCDPDTAGMVHYLVRRLGQSRVLWYASLTLGHIERDAPAIRVARALRAMPTTSRLQLEPFSVNHIGAVIQDLGRMNDGEAGRRLAEEVRAVTGGNPFFVIELFKTLLAQGTVPVDPVTGIWEVSDSIATKISAGAMPGSVQDAIADRVSRLPDELHAVLMTIATHDEGCAPSIISHVHGMSRLRAAVMADELVERYLVREEGGHYQCAHAIIAIAVRERMRPARRRELHRAIALSMIAIADEGGDALDPGRIAYHAQHGDEPGMAFRFAMLAAEASREQSMHEEALSWLDLAASCTSGPEQTAEVDRATASLLEAAGWERSPARPHRRRVVAQ